MFFRCLLVCLLPPLGAPAQDTSAAKLLWKLVIPGTRTESSPALAPDGTIYLGTFYGWLIAVTPEGKLKWRFKADMEIRSSPAVGPDGTIYFGSRDRHFYALTPDGKLKWKFAAGAWVDSSAALAPDGTVYFGSHDKHLYALTAAGKLKWKFAAGGIIFSSPSLAPDGTVYFGAHDNYFYAVGPDGIMKWKFPTGGPIDTSPTLAADGTVYFNSTDGILYALMPDGTERWHLRSGSYTSSTAVLDEVGNLYFAAGKDRLVVSPEGKRLFHFPGEVGMEASPVVTTNRMVLFSQPWLSFGGFPQDHPWPPEWLYQMDSNLAGSLMVNPDGVIYATSGWFLYAIRPPRAAPPVVSAWPIWRGNPQLTGHAPK